MLLSVFCFYDVVLKLFFKAACVLWVKAAQNSGWLSLKQSWCKHLLTVFFFFLFFFYIKCLLSVMNVFISGPALTFFKEFAQCVRLRWRQDPPFFVLFFCFEDFKLRIKTKTQDIAINHNLWSWPYLWENRISFLCFVSFFLFFF